MTQQTGNLGTAERAISALFGIGLSILALRAGGPLRRTITGAAGASLLARAFAGHCAMKAAVTGESTLRQGFADQWRRVSLGGGRTARPGSRISRVIDESVQESFPASDPPASRLPDVPPANAEAKWEAARAAERARANGRPASDDTLP